MDTVISLLVLSTLAQHVVSVVPTVTSFRAILEKVSGDSRIFSGEDARLRCSIPDIHNSRWDYLWFRGSEQLTQTGEYFVLWNAGVRDGGKFYCKGVRDTAVGNIYTLQSLPVEINVDGGWAILQVPPHPALVGDTLKVTCRLRRNFPIHEVILYKDGVEVMRQRGPNPQFYLTKLTLKDKGMYSCRASWDANGRTHSVMSADTSVQVLELVTQPVLEIVANNDQTPAGWMTLICHLQYNARGPAPPIHYYFYKDDKRLGTATSENHDLVRQSPGQYSCKAKVPQLDITRWSEPKGFGEVAGPQTRRPLVVHRKVPWPLSPQVSSPSFSMLPPAESTMARPSPHQSTVASSFIQPTEVSTQPSDPPLKPAQPTPSTVPPPVLSINQTATPTRDNSAFLSQESGDMSGESGDMLEESGDMSGNSSETVTH
ncbi:Fc receptor-like A [Trachinotus anak]|uniref:Fc receptor-like A n=1 Tax=Trachinotus anak TaxID=443729 RepID=UPI0039F1BEDB